MDLVSHLTDDGRVGQIHKKKLGLGLILIHQKIKVT